LRGREGTKEVMGEERVGIKEEKEGTIRTPSRAKEVEKEEEVKKGLDSKK